MDIRQRPRTAHPAYDEGKPARGEDVAGILPRNKFGYFDENRPRKDGKLGDWVGGRIEDVDGGRVGWLDFDNIEPERAVEISTFGGRNTGPMLFLLGWATAGTGVLFIQYPWVVLLVLFDIAFPPPFMLPAPHSASYEHLPDIIGKGRTPPPAPHPRLVRCFRQ